MTERGERQPLLANETHDDDDYRQETVISPDARQYSAERYKNGRFSSLEKILFGLSVALLILLCVFVGLYARAVYGEEVHDAPPAYPTATHSPGRHDNDTDTPLCLTPECVLAAADIIKDMDETVDPCDDFYAYTCNNWINSHSIPEGKSSVGTFLTLSTANKQVLHDILTRDFKPSAQVEGDLPDPNQPLDEQNFNKVKHLFDACMDESAIDARGAKPIYPLLRELRDLYVGSINLEATEAGEFATQDTFETQAVYGTPQQQLTRALSQLAYYGADSLFSIGIDADPKEPEKMALQLFQAGLTLPTREYYDQPDVVQTLFDTVAQTMDAVFRDSGDEFGWNRWSPNATARLVVEFEQRLANVSDLPEDLQDPKTIYNPHTLSELTALSPAVDWDLYLSRLLPPTAPHQDTVIVSSPRYLADLSDHLIGKSTQRSIQLYLMWQLIQTYADALSEDVRKPIKQLVAKLKGTDARQTKPRWETCLDEVNDSVGFLAGRYFALEKFSSSTKQRADGFVESIKNVFLQRLPELTWIDEATRERAKEKVAQLVRKVGYPTGTPNTMSPVSLSEYYADLSVKRDDYFANYLSSRQWQVKTEWQQVGKPSDRQKWYMNPQEVNAYYNPSFNEIVFPAGILQSPFFSGAYPDYLNYGGIGSVVGHELTHGFDNSGRQFDGQGRMVEWWTNETAKAFEERAQCFVKQYSSFVVDDGEGGVIHVNGKLTLGEDIADNGGLSQSFVAWQQQYANDPAAKERNQRLPGLGHLSPEQLFFINFGRIWCNKATAQQAKQSVLTDEHAPPRWRVNGAVQNSKHFADVFQCPVGSNMNPAKKCELW